MTIDQIIAQLTVYDGLPVKAIAAANAARATVLPAFLREIERYLAADETQRAQPNPLFFIFHLCGSWRATLAYRPLARLLQQPGDDLEHALGDALTATSHRVMAAVFDRDPAPLHDIILNAQADEFVRARMCDALVILASRGDIARAEVALFLREAFGKLDPQRNMVWSGWLNAVAMLGFNELKPLAQQALDRHSVDWQLMGYHPYADDAANPVHDFLRGHVGERSQASYEDAGDDFSLFGDTIAELSKWDQFSGQRAGNGSAQAASPPTKTNGAPKK